MKALRRQHMKDTAELKAMDSLILDEVEVNPMPLHESKKATLADWEALGEDVRAELIDGEIYYMAPPSRKHQASVSFLHLKIASYLEGKPCKVYPAPFGVYLHNEDGTTDAVEPDISVICDRDKLSTRGCEGAPTWIIEIVSPGNMDHDYVTKLSLYLRHGVKESVSYTHLPIYWDRLADPAVCPTPSHLHLNNWQRSIFLLSKFLFYR